MTDDLGFETSRVMLNSRRVSAYRATTDTPIKLKAALKEIH